MSLHKFERCAICKKAMRSSKNKIQDKDNPNTFYYAHQGCYQNRKKIKKLEIESDEYSK